MICAICNLETERGHRCAHPHCDRWICEGCAEGIAMCEDCWDRTRKEAGV